MMFWHHTAVKVSVSSVDFPHQKKKGNHAKGQEVFTILHSPTWDFDGMIP